MLNERKFLYFFFLNRKIINASIVCFVGAMFCLINYDVCKIVVQKCPVIVNLLLYSTLYQLVDHSQVINNLNH